MDYDQVMAYRPAPVAAAYGPGDAIAFARACGCGASDVLAAEDGRFLVEGPGFRVLPMFAAVLNENALWTQDPRFDIDWRKTVHAEEMLIQHRPLPAAAALKSSKSIDAVYDKGPGRGALMYETKRLEDVASGDLVSEVTVGTFLLGDGGFGRGAEGRPEAPPKPAAGTAPDAVLELCTADDCAAIYKLAPEFVAAAGVTAPSGQAVLRGVCAFGMAGRAAIAMACDYEPDRLVRFGLRYAGTIVTGETIRFEAWRLGPGLMHIAATAVERQSAIVHGNISFRED